MRKGNEFKLTDAEDSDLFGGREMNETIDLRAQSLYAKGRREG